MSLTPAQEQAIAARGNILVVAGAGTGKTRTLVERCLNCLLKEAPPVSLEEVLIVTFTEAAATEIRQRIRQRLEEELTRHPDDFHWHEQLALFDTAHIGTLHSFCLQLIRPHFYELEIDPQIAVLAEDEAQLLADETLARVLEGHYNGRTDDTQAVQQLIQVQATGSDQQIRALVLRLHHYTQTLPDPAGWFEKELALFAASEPLRWLEWLLASFAEFRRDWLPVLQPMDEIASQCSALLTASSDSTSRAALANTLEQLIAACDPNSGGRKKAWVKKIEAEAQFLLSLAKLGPKTDPLKEDWEWVRHQMAALLCLTREFGQAFNEAKRQIGVLDFHDLEQYALRLLWNSKTAQPTRIAAQWRQKLRFIFVDEYQDINAAQDKIIEALSGKESQANRFLVGDVKQSIYRFRQADPRIFQNYAASWQGKAGQTISLRDNFRSREAILDFINSFFTLVMRAERGGVCYNELARLRFGAPEKRAFFNSIPLPQVELHLRAKTTNEVREIEDPAEEGVQEILDLEEAAKEARLVGMRVRELKAQEHPVWDEKAKQFRPVAWSDIAVLLRSPSRKAECYAKEFARLKIPLLVQRSGFYDSIEISDLINLLRVLDNPLQDVPLLAVLRSPLAGLTVNDLAAIRLAAKGPIWTALILWHDSQKSTAKARSKTSEESAIALRKLSTFLDRYARWRRLARQSSLSRCLEVALAETQYDLFLLTQSRGEQRCANVQRLLRLAQQFDSFQRQGLFRFLRLIDAQQRSDTEPEVKAVATQDSVRLLSIHQSKGLEFPVVFVADLNKPFNEADLHAGIILDEQYGLCPQIKPPHTGRRYPSLPYWLARRRQKRELLGEELRLLYVAMTRARDTLILSAAISQKQLQTLGTKNPDSHSLGDVRSFFDWIGFWFSKHYAETALDRSVQDLTRRPAATSPAFEREQQSPVSTSGRTALLSWIIHDDNKLLEPGAEIGEMFAEDPVEQTAEIWERLNERLSWHYPFLTTTQTPAKASVTALRRRASAVLDEDIFNFRKGGSKDRITHETQRSRSSGKMDVKASAAEIGSAHHRFLQLVSIESTGSITELKREVQRLRQELAMTDDELELLNIDALAVFWNSDLGKQIRASRHELHRELEFTARFSIQALASLTGEPLASSLPKEFVVVQGVADLVVLKPSEIWLVDFKTDSIKPDKLVARAKFYEPQMKLYASALAQIYRRPVAGCWVYFLECSTAVAISV